MIVKINKDISGELIPLTTHEQLEELDRRSWEELVIIFKHSTRCGISHAALEEVERFARGYNHVAFYYLDLLVHRSISNEVTARYEIPHHSPQVLVIKQEKAINQATHYAIDEKWLRKTVG